MRLKLKLDPADHFFETDFSQINFSCGSNGFVRFVPNFWIIVLYTTKRQTVARLEISFRFCRPFFACNGFVPNFWCIVPYKEDSQTADRLEISFL